MRPLRLLTVLFTVVLGQLGFAGLAHADREVCIRYAVETVDSNQGEDYYKLNDEVHPYWKARGAYFQVFDPDDPDPNEPLGLRKIKQGTAALVNGCFTITDQEMGTADDVFIVSYLDAQIGSYYVRARQLGTETTGCNPDPFADYSLEPNQYCKPVVHTGTTAPLPNNQKYYFTFPSSIETNLMALTQFAVYWWDHFDPVNHPMTITTVSLDVVIDGTGCTDASPCSNGGWLEAGDASEQVIHVAPKFDRQLYKFLVAHEVGHVAELTYANREYGNDDHYYHGATDNHPNPYDLVDGGSCASDDVSHGATTVEWVSAAENEGFAHFVAADVYNDHTDSTGAFTYYKPEWFPTDFPLEGIPSANVSEMRYATRYMDRWCTVSEQFAGVELDWMRFFWDLHTDTGVDIEDHQLMMELHVGSAEFKPNFNEVLGYNRMLEFLCSPNSPVAAFENDFFDLALHDDNVEGNGVATVQTMACN